MNHRLSARTQSEGLPVAVADDRCTFSGSVSYGVWEFYFAEERFDFAVKRSTSDDYFIEFTSKSLHHFLTDHLFHLFGDDRHCHEETHAVVLYFGEYLLSDNLFDDQRNSDDDSWFDVGKCLCNDGRRWYAVKIIDVASVEKFK